MRYQVVGSLALRAYPSAVRAERGEEMLGTLLDAAEDSRRAFISGVTSLLVNGLRERARANARVGLRRLVADGFCMAAVLWSLIELWPMTHLLGVGPTWTVVLAAAIPVFAIIGRDRLAGLCGLILAVHAVIVANGGVIVGPGLVPIGHPTLVFFLDRWVGPGVCFMVMLLWPRKREFQAQRLIWLVPVAALVFAPPVAASVLRLIVVPVVGIILLPVDPRLAIASAVLWADIAAASTLGHTRLGLVTLPVVLLAVLIAIGRKKVLARQRPV